MSRKSTADEETLENQTEFKVGRLEQKYQNTVAPVCDLFLDEPLDAVYRLFLKREYHFNVMISNEGEFVGLRALFSGMEVVIKRTPENSINCILIYSQFRRTVPDEHRARVVELLSRVNFNLFLGRFHIDSDGDVRFELKIPIHGAAEERDMDHYFPPLIATLRTCDTFLPALNDVCEGHDAIHALRHSGMRGVEAGPSLPSREQERLEQMPTNSLCRVDDEEQEDEEDASKDGGFSYDVCLLPESRHTAEALELRCPVCFRVTPDLRQLTCPDGHVICLRCFKSLPSPSRCPTCRSRVLGKCVSSNRLLQRQVLALQCQCPFATNGCAWRGDLYRVKRHAAQCQHAEEETITSPSTANGSITAVVLALQQQQQQLSKLLSIIEPVAKTQPQPQAGESNTAMNVDLGVDLE